MAPRGVWVRSWRRTTAMFWRRRAVVQSVVVMVVIQVFVAACVVSLWQLQQEYLQEEQQEWPTTQEAPKRVGQYVLLVNEHPTPSTTVTTIHPTSARPHPAPSEGHRFSPSKHTLQGGEGKAVSKAENLILGTSGPAQRSTSLLDWDDGDNELLERLESIKRRDNGDPRRKERQDEHEEEDPDVGRGFQNEYVTYRSDGNSFLMVDDDQRFLRMRKSTTSYTHNDSVMKDELPPRKDSNDNSVRHVRSTFRNGESVDDDSAETKGYKFRSYDPANPFRMTMRDDLGVYFQDIGGTVCFIDGTDIDRSKRGDGGGCHCLDGYFGDDCGIPEAVWFDTYRNKYPETRLTRRTVPRRVINGVTLNHEFAMFEARLHELYPVVDVFLLAESNYTAHGDPKEFLFLKRLRRGYMKGFQDKILYVSLDTFPNISRSSGWVADAYLRVHMGINGIPLLKGLREDDLFVLSDADELPTREVITFLKLYDGYPEPISFALQWNVFGFFWRVAAYDKWTKWVKGDEERSSTVGSVATVGMLQKVMHNNAFFIRKTGLWQNYDLYKRIQKYRREGYLVKEWVIGQVGHYAGWHCSWCFSPTNIVIKMDSAQADDKPRFGDMPEKKNLTYITSVISQGMWFDDKEHYLPVRNPERKHYAPRYLLEHPNRYRSILYHPSHPLNLGQPWAPP